MLQVDLLVFWCPFSMDGLLHTSKLNCTYFVLHDENLTAGPASFAEIQMRCGFLRDVCVEFGCSMLCVGICALELLVPNSRGAVCALSLHCLPSSDVFLFGFRLQSA